MSLRIGAVLLLSVAAGAAEIPKPPGKLVAIGGYRLHLNCIGKGRPTVVLSPGGGDFSFDWYLVQKDVSRFARVCSYDRSGQAWSDPGPQPATMHQEAHDVRASLQAAHERGPYLLVGHSLGGVVMRVFANMYPDDTAGIVLVDATSPDTTLGMNGKLVHLRELAKPGPLPGVHTLSSGPPKLFSDAELKEAAEKRKGEGEPKIGSPYDRLPPAIQKLRVWALSLSPRAASGDDYMAEEFNDLYQQLASQPRPFGSKPLITIVGTRFDAKPTEVTQETWDALMLEKVQQKREYARLSDNGEVVEDAKAGHHVQLDDPDTVVNAIRKVAARVGNK